MREVQASRSKNRGIMSRTFRNIENVLRPHRKPKTKNSRTHGFLVLPDDRDDLRISANAEKSDRMDFSKIEKTLKRQRRKREMFFRKMPEISEA